MEKEQIEAIERAVKKALKEELYSGQHAEDHKFLQEVRPFLMNWMEYVRTSRNAIIKAFWTIVVGAVLGLMVMGFNIWLWFNGKVK